METKLVTSDSWSLLPKEERESRELAATRLKERLSSSLVYRLSPSEIESLRQDGKRASARAKELIAADKAKAAR